MKYFINENNEKIYLPIVIDKHNRWRKNDGFGFARQRLFT